MRYFISADIEGVTDVTTWEETEKGNPEYERARRQMTRETAAACRAILERGHEPWVRDGHDTALNLLHEELPRGTVLMRGWANDPATMMAGLTGDFAGALYIGYHAPGGSDGNPLAHTISSSRFVSFRLNGKIASEFTLNSLYAAERGVPSIFLSGDRCICDLAAAEVPGLITTAVKTGSGGSTCNLHPLDACDRIYEGVLQALDHPAPLRVVPDEIEVELTLHALHPATAGAFIPGVEKVDANTVRFRVRSISELTLIRKQLF
ncbi:MAG: M55 family metallopeptidase [Mogibacterium sp.]|nr:M55 family metallopeptidase [Mogibacterium sp.]